MKDETMTKQDTPGTPTTSSPDLTSPIKPATISEDTNNIKNGTNTSTPTALQSHTDNSSPIASIKRNIAQQQSSFLKEEGDEEEEQQQRWVSSTVDALFSPVLHFWKGGEEEGEEHAEPSPMKEDHDIEVYPKQEEQQEEEDVAMSGIDDDGPPSIPSNAQPLQDDSCDESIIEEDSESTASEEEEFNPYLFIKHLPLYQTVIMNRNTNGNNNPTQPLPPKPIDDPRRVSLVLDLDETLVHCTVDPTPNPDLVFPVLFNGIQYSVHVKKRPYLETFLQNMSTKFELICFTASQRVYADQLLDRIDPRGYIQHRLFRESCLVVSGNYLKDLNVLGRDLKSTVLVDNSPHAFGYQVDNGIPILSWFDDQEDDELLKLQVFLDKLVSVEDVRSVVRDVFQTWKLIHEA